MTENSVNIGDVAVVRMISEINISSRIGTFEEQYRVCLYTKLRCAHYIFLFHYVRMVNCEVNIMPPLYLYTGCL